MYIIINYLYTYTYIYKCNILYVSTCMGLYGYTMSQAVTNSPPRCGLQGGERHCTGPCSLLQLLGDVTGFHHSERGQKRPKWLERIGKIWENYHRFDDNI